MATRNSDSGVFGFHLENMKMLKRIEAFIHYDKLKSAYKQESFEKVSHIIYALLDHKE
jgi:hypothetical protein